MHPQRKNTIYRVSWAGILSIAHLAVIVVTVAIFTLLMGEGITIQSLLSGYLTSLPLRFITLVKWLKDQQRVPWAGWMLADIAFLTACSLDPALFEQSGLLLFGISMLGAAVVVNPMHIARFNAALIIGYVVLLHVHGTDISVPEVWLSEVSVLALFAFTSIMFSVYRIQNRSRNVLLREVLLDAFERLHVNLALLDAEGRFLKVNARAQISLERTESELKGIPFSDLISYRPTLIKSISKDGAQSGVLTKKSGEECPVAYENVVLHLPAEVVDRSKSTEAREYQLVVFTDMTDIVKGHEAISLQKRNQTVNNMLEVFADGVRNPLAGISAYVQTLERLEKKSPDSESREQHLAIYQRMIHDITDLDQLLESLMNNTRMSPDEVEKHFTALKEKRQQAERESFTDEG